MLYHHPLSVSYFKPLCKRQLHVNMLKTPSCLLSSFKVTTESNNNNGSYLPTLVNVLSHAHATGAITKSKFSSPYVIPSINKNPIKYYIYTKRITPYS